MTWHSVGASVPGPARMGGSNQDAWKVWSDSMGTLAVVADGLGSRPHARMGALGLLRAARQAWCHWAPAPVASPEDFLRLLEVLWRLSLRAILPEDAATTCILVGIRADGRLLRCQLGDGLLGWEANGQFCRMSPVRQEFGSSTLCLGAPHRLQDWQFRLDSETPLTFLLATDGVADDLREDRSLEFLHWLQRDCRTSTRLHETLLQWPVPHHLDDKTLVLLWNN